MIAFFSQLWHQIHGSVNDWFSFHPHWLTPEFIALLLGPFLAVWWADYAGEQRVKKADQLQIFRQLVATHRLAGDGQWTLAINMILVAFDKHKRVLAARRAYIAATKAQVGVEDAQKALLVAVSNALKRSLTEEDFANETYVANGLIARDSVLVVGHKALIDIANVLGTIHGITPVTIEEVLASAAALVPKPKVSDSPPDSSIP